MPYPESLEVAGVQLERWHAQRDLAGLLALAGDDDVRRFLQVPTEPGALAGMSERFAQHWRAHGFGLWSVRPADSVGAGWVGACHPGWHPEFVDAVELAWSVTAALRGRGLVTSAARAAAAACFAELGLERVLAFVDPENARSLAVAARVGMLPAGETRHPKDGAVLLIFELGRSTAG